ncbi:hypothetical protein Taro_001825 [Colocasia esculenta]|uniref:Uncharacterized protein n=1 Tax=Colocasia esculenta TaxID=4460 RepID=A0A843TC48_COLES|nr:hypothetical protein [Colocasia esculenta]
MAHKQAPRRGARSRATARPIPADDAPPSERRTKRRHDPAEQPGPSSASPSTAKRGRTSSGRGRGSAYPRRKILESSPEVSEQSSSSSSESSQPSKPTPSKPLSAGKIILKPRAVDLEDKELNDAFPEVINFFKFQSWQPFISEFRIIYPRLVQEFYQNLECTDDGYESKVKGIEIDMPTDIATTIFKIPDEGADYHNFEFNLHEAYTILTGLQADETDLKQTHVTKFNTNTFPPVLRLTHHILTTIITPQGGGRDRLTDIQRIVGDQVRRGPAAIEAPVVQEDQPPILIGTLGDASIELKEHQEELEIVLKGILANSQADVFNTKETLSQISKTRLSFAHLVDDLESMKNLSAHIDEEMSALKKEFKVLNRPAWSAGSSSSSQPMSTDLSALQATIVHVVCVCVASSATLTVVTSSVGSPRFCVSQAHECSGLVPVLVYHRGLCRLPGHPHSCVELYVWLRERWQWDNDLELGLESLKVPGMGLRQCGPQEWCWLDSIVSWLVLMERQLDLSSVAARLRGEGEKEASHPSSSSGLHCSGLRLVHGGRSRIRHVIGLTDLDDEDCYSWYQSKDQKWQIERIGEVVEMNRERSLRSE